MVSWDCLLCSELGSCQHRHQREGWRPMPTGHIPFCRSKGFVLPKLRWLSMKNSLFNLIGVKFPPWKSPFTYCILPATSPLEGPVGTLAPDYRLLPAGRFYDIPLRQESISSPHREALVSFSSRLSKILRQWEQNHLSFSHKLTFS